MSGIIDTIGSKSGIIGRSKDTVKAWVRFDGASFSVAKDFGVSSVTDEGTGQYFVNLDNVMADTNFVSSCEAVRATQQGENMAVTIGSCTTSRVAVANRQDGGTYVDANANFIAVWD